MAKRRSRRSDSRASLYGYLFFAIVLVIVFIGPILLVAAWVLAEISKILSRYKGAQSFKDFDLDPDDRGAMVRAFRNLSKTQSKLEEIKEKGSSLQTRQDGYYSERSKLGKELNAKLQVLEPALEEAEEEFNDIATVPLGRYGTWKFLRLAVSSTRAAMLGFTITFGFLLAVPIDALLSFGNFLNRLSLIGPFFAPSLLQEFPHFYGASLTALAIGLVLGFLGYFLGKGKAAEALQGDLSEIDYVAAETEEDLAESAMGPKPEEWEVKVALLDTCSEEEIEWFLADCGFENWPEDQTSKMETLLFNDSVSTEYLIGKLKKKHLEEALNLLNLPATGTKPQLASALQELL